MSRVIDGCATFNDIHDGVPRISPSLLTARLRELEAAGLVSRRRDRNGKRFRYSPTPAGRDLAGIIDDLAIWGQHWARDMDMDDLDPGFLAWSMHLRLDTAAMPPGRTVMQFEFDGAPADCRRFWLVNRDGEVDMCLKHPGYEVDLSVHADLRCFVEAWRGFRDLRSEIRAGRIRVTGPRELVRGFPDWLMLSALAPYERRTTGREKRLADKHAGTREAGSQRCRAM